MENKRIHFAEASDSDIKRLVDNLAQIHEIYRNDLRAFALRNYLEDYKINKHLSGLLAYQRIMPLAERLSSKFHSYPRSFASLQTGHFSEIFRPWALSTYVSVAERGLFAISPDPALLGF